VRSGNCAIKKNACVASTEFWTQIDEETGEEPKQVDVVLKPTDRAGFMITYLTAIIGMIDKLGNQKMQVIKYLLQKVDKSSNFCILWTTVANGEHYHTNFQHIQRYTVFIAVQKNWLVG